MKYVYEMPEEMLKECDKPRKREDNYEHGN